MIAGRVNSNRDAVVPVALRSAANRRRRINAVVDTGFTGYVSLPPALISRLKLPFRGRKSVVLADGRVVRCDVFAGTILWHRKLRLVTIDCFDSDPLIGMALLDGSDLHIRVMNAGTVKIAPIR